MHAKPFFVHSTSNKTLKTDSLTWLNPLLPVLLRNNTKHEVTKTRRMLSDYRQSKLTRREILMKKNPLRSFREDLTEKHK